MVSEVKSEEITNLWNEIEGRDKDGKLDDKVKTGIRALLSEKGSLAVNKLACALMVTDFPRNLEMVEKFLQQVERTVNRQVIIEAKILEVTLNDRFQMGIDWRFLPQMASAGFGWGANQNLTGTTGTIPPSWQVPPATTGTPGRNCDPAIYRHGGLAIPAGAGECHFLSPGLHLEQPEIDHQGGGGGGLFRDLHFHQHRGASDYNGHPPQRNHRGHIERDPPDR